MLGSLVEKEAWHGSKCESFQKDKRQETVLLCQLAPVQTYIQLESADALSTDQSQDEHDFPRLGYCQRAQILFGTASVSIGLSC
jgi:hypothetical protein